MDNSNKLERKVVLEVICEPDSVLESNLLGWEDFFPLDFLILLFFSCTNNLYFCCLGDNDYHTFSIGIQVFNLFLKVAFGSNEKELATKC